MRLVLLLLALLSLALMPLLGYKLGWYAGATADQTACKVLINNTEEAAAHAHQSLDDCRKALKGLKE